MDLRSWILADVVDAHERFATSVAAHVPKDRWRDRPGGEGASIAALRLHATRHRDLAIVTAVRGQAPLAAAWWEPLGLAGRPADAALSEAEDPELTRALDLDALDGYAEAVHEAVSAWVSGVDLADLDEIPPASDNLEAADVAATQVPWLHRQWSGRLTGWFVRWPAVGHLNGHVGEMVAVRGRLGLSPF